MPIKLTIDNHLFLLKDKIKEVTTDFLSSYGLEYFQYLRCYKDGSVGLLTNKSELFEFACENIYDAPVVFSFLQEEHKNQNTYFFMWDKNLPEFPVKLAKEKFNISNGITLVRRTKNYYDLIAVAENGNSENNSEFYLNKLKAIENFILKFDKSHLGLIEYMDKTKIFLPEAYRDINYQKLCLSENVTIMGKYGVTYITPQELLCIKLYLEKYSYKEIANLIKVSPRTVESYINRVKLRTGFTCKNEIEISINYLNCV